MTRFVKECRCIDSIGYSSGFPAQSWVSRSLQFHWYLEMAKIEAGGSQVQATHALACGCRKETHTCMYC